MSNDNILFALGICDKEDVISDLIRFCFEHSKPFADFFLNEICTLNGNNYSAHKIFTRKSFTDFGIPDIIILSDQEERTDLTVIENKLKAEEGWDQTKRYGSDELANKINQRLGSGKDLGQIKRIFLTMFPDQAPQNDSFMHRTYQAFVNNLKLDEIDGQPASRILLSNWIDLLREFYSKSVISPSQQLEWGLINSDPLDGSYLFFCELFKKAPLPVGLETDWTFRSSLRGRKYYGAVLAKESWRSPEMQDDKQINKSVFQGHENYHIHLEPQYNVLNQQLSIYLHYELNPYCGESWARKNIVAEDLDKYLQRRQNFKTILSDKCPVNLKIGGRWNQVGKATLAIDKDWTVGDFWEIFHNETDAICQAVDLIQNELK